MNKPNIVFAVCLFFFAEVALADTNDLTMLVAGQKDDVLSVVRNSLVAAFPDGQIANAEGNVGFRESYRSVWTGWHQVFVNLEPMTNEGSFEATAYLLRFGYQTEPTRPMANGKQDVKDLMAQIEKQAPLNGKATIVSNPSTYKTMFDRYQMCFENFKDDPELQLIAKKTSLVNTNDITLFMLADESKSSSAEKDVILTWSAKRDKCAGLMKLFISFSPKDPHNPLLLEGLSAVNQMLLGLYKGELTFGEFNKRRQDYATESRKKFAELNSSLNKEQTGEQAKAAEIERQHQVELQRISVEQQKANAMLIQTMQGAAPTTRPNANINCTSRNVGGAVQTNCN